jgi:hypothetical protein
MVVFLPKLAEKSLFLLFLLLCGRALSMTFAVTTDGGKRLYLGVPDSRDFYDSPSEDDGTAPGAYYLPLPVRMNSISRLGSSLG